MRVYIDGLSNMVFSGGTVDTSATLADGKHHITVKGWDRSGLVFSSSIDVTVSGTTPPPPSSCVPPASAPNLSVTICSPLNNAQVGSEALLTAAAKSTATISAMRVYLDGVSVYLFHDKFIETSLILSSGAHHITAKAWDTAGHVFSSTINITSSSGGGGGNPPPPPSGGLSPRRYVTTPGATVQYAASNVTSWAVDNITGGNSTVGTITSAGLYTAPSQTGTHTVKATTSGGSLNATIYIGGVDAVVTNKYDLNRTGAMTHETALSPSTVNKNNFGKLFSYAVDGNINAQPLYVANIGIPGFGTRNVVYVATEHNSVYAFDAEGRRTTAFWRVNFGPSIPSVDTGTTCCIAPEIGITGTPVIDTDSGTLFAVAATKENGKYFQRLHAIDIRTGAERAGSPVTITAKFKGKGDSPDGSGNVTFDALHLAQRPALLLANGRVYITWASYNDIRPYHGWVIAYDARTLQQAAVWNATPDGWGGGIWQSAGGPAADDFGNVYISTGNGTFDASNGGRDYSQSIVKLDRNLNVLDYFTPFDWSPLNARDRDVGSGGVMLVPNPPAGVPPRLAVNLNKGGAIYALDADSLGKLRQDSNSQIFQSLTGAIGVVRATPAYWNGRMYAAAQDEPLKQFRLTSSGFAKSAQTANTFPFPGTSPVVSANGTSGGIVWGVRHSGGAAIIYAFDANTMSLLWDNTQAGSRDTAPSPIRFNVPMIVNGRVYLGGKGQIVAFGLLP